ncbi:MAG: hypothetical protein KY395_01675 [Actinobacteria bacterium]|nr:hypothetical protein [Actinomycetota bacterium]
MTRFAFLVLADRSGWPQRMQTWTDRFEIALCTSPEEARALVGSSRPWTAFVVDGNHPAVDRDLLALAAKSGAPPIVVADSASVDWIALGAVTVLNPEFDSEDLNAAVTGPRVSPERAHEIAPVVSVTGPGGTGASTIAIALAQGLARHSPGVLLADFARHAEQHVLHNLRPDRPGIGDLVEAHRTAAPDAATLRQLPEEIPARGYRVLGGLRRSVGWSSLRPRAVEATLNGLRGAHGVIVCDVDADLEGEAESGSFDVEERNTLARSAVAASSAVVVVGGPGIKGTHAMLRVLGEMWAHGVSPGRTVAVVNRGDETSLEKLSDALGRLAGRGRTLLFVPEAPVDAALLDSLPLPMSIVAPVTDAVLPLVEGPRGDTGAGPMRIQPGSLGVPANEAGPDT